MTVSCGGEQAVSKAPTEAAPTTSPVPVDEESQKKAKVKQLVKELEENVAELKERDRIAFDHPLSARAAKFEKADNVVFRGMKFATFDIFADADFRRRVGDFALNNAKSRVEFTLRQAGIQIISNDEAASKDDFVAISIEVTSLVSNNGECSYFLETAVLGRAYVERRNRLVMTSLYVWKRGSLHTSGSQADVPDQFLNGCLNHVSKLGNDWMASNPVRDRPKKGLFD